MVPREWWFAARSLWWRRGASAAVLLVATITLGAAALGPIYARAADESTLRDQLVQAGSAAGLHIEHHPWGGLTDAISRFAVVQKRVPAPGSVIGYPTRIPSIYETTDTTIAHGRSFDTVSGVVWRPGACRHLRIVRGHCPTRAGQGLVSARSATFGYSSGWKLGRTIQTHAGASIRIVGTYVPRNPTAAFWFQGTYFDAAPGFDIGPNITDAVFVTRATFGEVAPRTQAVLSWDFPLDARAIRLDDVPTLVRATATLARRITRASAGPMNLELTTRLDAVLTAAAHQRHLVNIGTLLVTLQLSVLAALVLFQVIADTVESRGNEIALAKLRGFRPRRTAWFVLSEPLLLLAVAAPLGLAVAWTAAHAFAAAVLRAGTPVVLTWYTAAALLAGFAGGALAAVGGSYRALTRPVLTQWRRTTTRSRPSRVGLAIDLVISLAAVAGLVILRESHRAGSSNDTAALLAPGLFVVGVALLGTRLLPLATRSLLGFTRGSRRVGLFLAARQVARRPAVLRLAALLGVAIGLATFAVSGEAVATTNRTHRAEAEVGAARVIAIQYEQRLDPVTAVRHADPHGRWAMAAATWLPDGGDSVDGTVLGVDASRLTAVGYPAAGGPDTARLAAAISASAAPMINFHGRAVRIRASIESKSVHGAAPEVQIGYRTPRNQAAAASAGRIRTGTHSYTGTLRCPDQCTFTGIVLNRPVTFNGTMRGTVVVRSLDRLRGGHWSPLPANLTHANQWRPGPEYSHSRDELTASRNGLEDHYWSSSAWGGIAYAYDPSPLPTVATPRSLAANAPNPGHMVDALSDDATFTVVQYVPVLPLVLDDGLVVNLNYLRAQLPGFDSSAHWMVWLGPHAPADAMARLRAAGLVLENQASTSSRIVQLGRQGPALSLFLLLACAIVGSAVAVGGTAVAVSASARRRSFETAALRAVGVRRAALYRGGVIEQVLLLGGAVLLGVPAGALAAHLAMPAIPEFANPTPVTLEYQPAPAPVAVLAGSFVLLVVATAAVAARAVLRAARPSRLREDDE